MSVIDDYLNKIDSSKRKPLERILHIAKFVVPNATETISYGMPTLQYKGKSFLGFDAHTNHLGIYPFGSEEIEVFKSDLKEYGLTKGAIQVSYTKSFPKNLLVKIIKQ